MLVNLELVKESIRRLDFDPQKRSTELGDGPRRMTPVQKRDRYKSLLAATGNPERARIALERFIGGNDLVSTNYLARGIAASRSVCRIRVIRGGKLAGCGTGFLVAPGVVMTNHHVLSNTVDAASAECDFNYELDLFDRECAPRAFRLEPQRFFLANRDLDFALIAVADRSLDGAATLREFLHLPLREEPGKSAPGEYLSIIQHPSGERKQVCVRENKMLRYDRRTVWYLTDTVPGSSGSPVFNNLWQVVAIHHSGVPETDANGNWLTIDGHRWDSSMDETQVKWKANEGIRISEIVAYLRGHSADHPCVRRVLEAPDPVPVPEFADLHPAGRISDPELRDGEMRVTIPINVLVRVGGAAPATAPVRADDVSPARLLATPRSATNGGNGHLIDASDPADDAVEAVNIDQSHILRRPGYRADFLGSGDFEVTMPTVRDADLKKQLLGWKYKGVNGTELKYYNYSVLHNKVRKLAFVAAVNIDGRRLQDVGKRSGDRWYEDPRARGFQVTDSQFYKIQLREADRSLNPFDRGHLVRRLDATWGVSVAIGKRNGDDTFHFTNCSPQFWRFNQGAGSGAARLWAGIEDYALARAARGEKLSVFNGPVFDAPKSRFDDGDGQPIPRPDGERAPDRKLLDIGIPRWFWKIIVMRAAGNRLAAHAYVLSQEAFLDDIDDLETLKLRPLTEAQARAFGISIVDLERLTGLDFGRLRSADQFLNEGATGPRPLRSESDLGF